MGYVVVSKKIFSPIHSLMSLGFGGRRGFCGWHCVGILDVSGVWSEVVVNGIETFTGPKFIPYSNSPASPGQLPLDCLLPPLSTLPSLAPCAII